ncbi:MAG TPA: glycosyltransferase [Thermoanaerobaculia bacterium]|jgi:glycosyltransferase involved in cell wall biosynthesis
MRIGLDLLFLIPGVVGGTETYARGLIAGLAAAGRGHEFVVFVNEEAAEWPLPEGPFTRVVCPVRAESRAARYAFQQLRLPAWARVEELDVLHSLGYVTALDAPCASVVTIPDVNTVAFGAQLPLLKRVALGAFTRWSGRSADRILTISEFSKGQIVEHLGVQPGKVMVTLLAADARPRAQPTRGGSEPYIVAFSSASPNKNLPRLLEAFAVARARHDLKHELVLVGHRPPGARDSEGIRFTGWLPDAQRDEALAGADLLVLPSLYEGFGLPVLEAMAAGVPVLCSNRASLPEVGGSAAEYFDPENVDEIARKIAALATDSARRERMREAGLRNAARFSWEKTAAATLAAYEEAFAAWRRTGLVIVNQGGGPMFRDFVNAAPATFGRVDYRTSDPAPVGEGVVLHASAPLRPSSRLRKAFAWASFVVRAGASVLAPGSPKRILLVTNPPFSPLLGLLARTLRGSRYVLVFFDVYPRALTALTPASPRSPVVRLWHAMNRAAVARAEAVVTISADLAREVERYLAPDRGPRRVEVVPTWVDARRVRPVSKAENTFAVRHGQAGCLTILYAGNLGALHDLSLLPELAESLREDPRVRFLVAGDGAGRAALEAEVARRGLPNVTWLPPQPEADLPLLLATGDVALVALARGAEGVSMPSKTYFAMAAGSAIFGLSRPGSDLARVIESFDCGVNADPADREGAVAALRGLLVDKEKLARCRANARRAAESEFSTLTCVPRLLELVRSALA